MTFSSKVNRKHKKSVIVFCSIFIAIIMTACSSGVGTMNESKVENSIPCEAKQANKNRSVISNPREKMSKLDSLVKKKPQQKTPESGQSSPVQQAVKQTASASETSELNQRDSTTDENTNESTKEGDETFRPFDDVLPQQPIVPSINPSLKAPEQYEHPLQTSEKLAFMLGEDNKGYYLYSEGPVEVGAYQKFLRYVAHYKEQGIHLNRFMMHSPGGVLNEGIKIGEYIHENDWDTDADKYMKCYSACGFIYASGRSKYIQSGAEVGFHRPYLPDVQDTPELIRQVYEDYQPYWKLIGGNEELYEKFMKGYGRDDMYILNSKNIGSYMNVETY